MAASSTIVLRLTTETYTTWSGNGGSNNTVNEFTSNATVEDFYQEPGMIFVEILNLINLASITWVFFSLIAYGSKTERFIHTPKTSRLNSGAIYVVAILATLFTMAKFSVNEAIHHVNELGSDDELCRTLVNTMMIVYFVALYSTYIFLWILQRRIYTHPYVRDHVSPVMNRFSSVFVILLAVGFASSIASYYIIENAHYTNRGCVQLTDKLHVTVIVIFMILAVVFIQITMVGLFIYPAYKVRFPPPADENSSTEIAIQYPAENGKKSIWHRIIGTCVSKSYSPIEITVKRAVVLSSVMVFTDVTTMGVYAFVVPNGQLVMYHAIGNDISSTLNVFCMLFTFSFASKVLTVFCPSCGNIPVERRKRTQNIVPTEMTNA